MLSHRAQVIISDGDLHAVVSICSIVLLIVAILSTFGRIFTKVSVMHKVALDDYTVFPALVLCGAQTAAILIASGNGLGQHWGALTDAQRIRYEQSLYAADLLFIPAIVMAKLSMILLIRGLVLDHAHARIGHIFGAGVMIWGVGSEFSAAFQCRGPKPWHVEGNVCFDISAFWNLFNAINVLTDIFLVLWPSFIIFKLHAALHRRLITIAFFACRLCVVGAVVAQIVFSNRALSTNDPSFDLWPAVLCTQTVQALSITTACILYLRPFLESLESGLIRSDDLRRSGLEGIYGYRASKDTKKGSNPISLGSGNRAVIPSSFPLRPLQDLQNTTTVRTEDSQWEDGQSENSQTRIIRRTTSWAVSREPRSPDAFAST